MAKRDLYRTDMIHLNEQLVNDELQTLYGMETHSGIGYFNMAFL